MSLWQLALTFFLVANPIGNTPAFVSLVKDFDFAKQRKILFRESIFSFLIAFIFLFIGEPFLAALQFETYSLSLCGGTLLFIVALNMIFPPQDIAMNGRLPQEPFIVPIATPLITGGGVLSTIMIYAKQQQNTPKMMLALVIAYIAVTFIVVSASYFQKILGRKGLLAMEQLMGMMLALLSMQLMVNGAAKFAQVLREMTP